MNIWSARNLTPYGRNTVLKSLLLPKLSHLFSALPRPAESIIENFQKQCFRFIWRNKPDIVKRDVVVLNTEHGGLKVPMIKHVISSLKLKWVERLQRTSSNWKSLLMDRLHSQNLLWISDSTYIENRIIHAISNPFWIEVFKDWSNTVRRYKEHVKTERDLLSQGILNNDNIKVGNKTICYRNWEKRGIIFVNDLLNENGRFYSKEEFCALYTLDTDFLKYEGVKRAVICYANSIGITLSGCRLCNPVYPFIMKCTNNRLGHQKVYDMLTESGFVKLTCYNKWEHVTGSHYSDIDSKHFNIIANKCTPSTELKWLQYRIIHRILPVRHFLYKINYVDSPKCTFCNDCDETIYHIFWECDKVESIWREMKTWLRTIDVEMSFTKTQVMFGIKGKHNNAINAIIILVKNIIYNCSKRGFFPNISYIKSQITQYYNITKYIYINRDQEAYFVKLWSSLHMLFRTV